MKKNSINCLAVFLILILQFIFVEKVFADMSINLVAVNATDSTKDYPITYYLPKELTPEDIVDVAGLNIDYDIPQQAYFLTGNITLGPKESRTIKIMVHDVWKVSKDEIVGLKKEADENAKRLEGTDSAQTSKELRDSLIKQLDQIAEKQENFSGNIERRIEQYRADVDRLTEIKNVLQSIEYWEGKKGKVVPTKVGKEYQGKIVKFVVDVENPAENGTKTFEQQHYLPSEIREENIVDAQGFEFRYDKDKKQGYLTKKEEFKSGEKKHYEISIKDIWNIPDEQMKDINGRAEGTFEEIKNSPYGKEYMTIAEGLMSGITTKLDNIDKLQKEKKTMKNHIGAYRVNQQRFERSREDLESLEKILALAREKRLEELEKSRVKNVLQKLQSLNGIQEISKAVFGSKPTKTTTWKIIIGTLIFVAFFTAFHFITWQNRSKAAKLKEIERKKAAGKA